MTQNEHKLNGDGFRAVFCSNEIDEVSVKEIEDVMEASKAISELSEMMDNSDLDTITLTSETDNTIRPELDGFRLYWE